jgi:hypothetical protein
MSSNANREIDTLWVLANSLIDTRRSLCVTCHRQSETRESKSLFSRKQSAEFGGEPFQLVSQLRNVRPRVQQ